MGGLAVDTSGRVMDTKSTPMRGLYAAGEIMGGVHGENRLGGSSLLDCVVFGLASADDILKEYPLLKEDAGVLGGTIGGTVGGTAATTATVKISETEAPTPPVAPAEQLRIQVEDRYFDLSRFVNLHPGGALLVEKGEDLTTRFQEAHGDDWGLFERDEITQVTVNGNGVGGVKPVKEHRTANYGSSGGGWREIVGRRTWFFLHSVAAKYPDNPSDNDKESGKYSKRRRSNVAVIIVRIVFTSSILFYCLLLNHSFQTNPNSITNCFKLFFLLQLYNYV